MRANRVNTHIQGVPPRVTGPGYPKFISLQKQNAFANFSVVAPTTAAAATAIAFGISTPTIAFSSAGLIFGIFHTIQTSWRRSDWIMNRANTFTTDSPSYYFREALVKAFKDFRKTYTLDLQANYFTRLYGSTVSETLPKLNITIERTVIHGGCKTKLINNSPSDPKHTIYIAETIYNPLKSIGGRTVYAVAPGQEFDLEELKHEIFLLPPESKETAKGLVFSTHSIPNNRNNSGRPRRGILDQLIEKLRRRGRVLQPGMGLSSIQTKVNH